MAEKIGIIGNCDILMPHSRAIVTYENVQKIISEDEKISELIKERDKYFNAYKECVNEIAVLSNKVLENYIETIQNKGKI